MKQYIKFRTPFVSLQIQKQAKFHSIISKSQFIERTIMQQRRISDYLSEFILHMHNQQPATLLQLSQLMQLSPTQSLTFNLLTQQLNLSLTYLRQNIHKQPQYFQQTEYIISRQLRKVGRLAMGLAKLINFTSQQQRLLAEYETMRFMQLFNVSGYQSRSRYFVGSRQQQQQYNLVFLNFIKSIYPRVNVHKDNLPLYIPFYSSIRSYEEDTPVGNPNWELARRVLKQVYKQEMVGVLEEETREEEEMKGSQQEDGGNNDDSNNRKSKRDIWFQLLMCDPEYLKRHQQPSLQRIWSLIHFYYVQQTLKPYRTMSSHQQPQQQTITISSITQALKTIINQQQASNTMKLLYSVILYQLTSSDWDLANVINFSRQMMQQRFSRRIQGNENIDDRQLNFVALVNTECCQLIRNLIQIENQSQMKDQERIMVLTQLLKQTIDCIHFTVTNRLPYHSHYLRVAYPSHTVDLQERLDNEQKILNTLLQQMQKDSNQATKMKYSFPDYPYFDQNLYEQFSRAYLVKHPDEIIQIASFLPEEVAVWGLVNSHGLEIKSEFKKIRSLMFSKQQAFLKCIKERVPEMTQHDYINFIHAWDLFNQMIDKRQYYGHDVQKFMKMLSKNQLTVNYICELKLPQLFKQHTYFVLDNGTNILKMLFHMVEGLDDILLTVDFSTQERIINEYLQFLSGDNFKSILLVKMTEAQRDQLWRKWVTVLMADESLVRELGGGEEKELIVEREEVVIEEKIIIKSQIQPKKPFSEVVVMDLQD